MFMLLTKCVTLYSFISTSSTRTNLAKTSLAGTGMSLFDLCNVECVDSISSEPVIEQLNAYTFYDSQFYHLLTKINNSPLPESRLIKRGIDLDYVHDLLFGLNLDQVRQII